MEQCSKIFRRKCWRILQMLKNLLFSSGKLYYGCMVICGIICDTIYDIDAVLDCRMQHKCDILIFRRRQPCFIHLLIHPVNAFSKFLHIIILMQKCSNFRVSGKVDLAHVVQTDNTGQVSRAFHNNPIVKHFDLNIGAFDAVFAVRGGIYDNQSCCF